MIALQVVVLALVYLVAVGSWTLWDVAFGAGVAWLAIAWIARFVVPRLPHTPIDSFQLQAGALTRLLLSAVAGVAAGSFRVLRLVLTRTARPGFIDVPTDASSEASLALSAFLLTLSPDSFVVEVDEQRRVIVVHVLDARRADALRRQHRDQYRRDIASLFPRG